jgi:hypothetical protein
LYNPVLAHPSPILLFKSLSHLVAAAADLLPLRRLFTVNPHLAGAMRAVSTHLSVASLHQQRRSFARCRSRCAVHRAPRASRYPSWNAVCTETSHLRRCPIVRAYSGAYHRSRRTLSLSKRLMRVAHTPVRRHCVRWPVLGSSIDSSLTDSSHSLHCSPHGQSLSVCLESSYRERQVDVVLPHLMSRHRSYRLLLIMSAWLFVVQQTSGSFSTLTRRSDD